MLLPLPLVQTEAFLAGVAACFFEAWIWWQLVRSGRALHYYHLYPLVAGAALIGSAYYPTHLPLATTATLLSVASGINVYNTFYVHVVMLRAYVQPPVLDGDANVFRELFLPKYTSNFFPWGVVAQYAWSILIAGHAVLRAWNLGELVEAQLQQASPTLSAVTT